MGGLANTLGLLFEISADPSGAERSLSQFAASVKGHMAAIMASSNTLESRGQYIGELMQTTLRAGLLGAGAVSGAILEMARRTANAAEEFLKLSAQTGASVHDLSALKFVAEQNETSFEALTQGLRILNRNIAELTPQGAKAVSFLKQLGVETRTATGEIRPSIDILKALADKFKEAPDGAQKTAIAMALFGRQGAALIPLLNQGSEAIDRQTKLAEQLGVVMDEKAARAADAFGDQLDILKAALTGVSRKISFEVIPGITEWAIKGQLLNVELKEWKLRLESAAYALEGTGRALQPFKGDEARAFFKMATEAANEAAQADIEWNAQLSVLMGALHAAGKTARDGAGDNKLNVDSTKDAAKHTRAWSTDLSALNAILRELRGAQDQVTQAHEGYRDILQRIATATGPAYNATMLEKLAIEQRDAAILKTVSEEQIRVDQAITKHVPQIDTLSQSILAATIAQTRLTEEERAALPAVLGLDNALTRQLVASRAAVMGMMDEEIPARQRIELAYDRQVAAADRAIAALRREYEEHKITRAQMEADERAYSDLMVSLSQQRSGALVQEGTIARRIFLDVSGAMLNAGINALVYSKSVGQALQAALKATLASLAQSAAIHALEEVATGFAWLSAWPVPRPDLAAMAFTSAKWWGLIAGLSLAGAIAIPSPNARGNNAVTAAIPGAKEGGEFKPEGVKQPSAVSGQPSAGSETGKTAAFGPGTGGPAAPRRSLPVPPGGGGQSSVTLVVQFHGPVYGGRQGIAELVSHISDAVERQNLHLVASRALSPPYAAR